MIGILVSSQQTVFISYSSTDTDMAKVVYAELKNRGFSPWMAATDVPAGANYAQTIIEALQSASAVLVILTEAAINSQHVKREVNVAIDQEIPLFPLNLSGRSDVLPLLTLDWKYWLTIIQILNCKDALSGAHQFIHAYNRQNSPKVNKSPFTLKKVPNQEFGDREAKAREEAEAKKRKVQEDRELEERMAREARERKEKAEAKRKEEIRLTNEAKEREEREKVEKERKRIEDEKKRVASSVPRIEEAKKTLDWLKELTDWLTEAGFSNDAEDTNFDLKDFERNFNKSFISNLVGIEDLAGYVHREIGQELLYIYRLFISQSFFTGKEPERALKYLKLALEHSNPWACIAEAEYLFVSGDKRAEQLFVGDTSKNRVQNLAKSASRYWCDPLPESDTYRKFNTPPSPGDSQSNDRELQEAARKEFIFTWEWLSLLFRLNQSASRVVVTGDRVSFQPDGEAELPLILQRIEEVLDKDSANPLSSDVYLSSPLRRKWIFLEGLILFRQGRDRAARKLLGKIKPNDEETIDADLYFRSLFHLAKPPYRNVFSELLEVISKSG